jgi:hypothetical protein
LNDQLQAAGYNVVSSRMYRHYRKLLSAGYLRYVPINRFDVAQAADPYEIVTSGGRYPYRASDVGVQAIFAKGSSLLQASGRAIDVADVGAVLMFADAKTVAGLQNLRPSTGEMLTIHFLDADRTVTGRISETDLSASPVLIEVQYAQLMSIADIADGDVLSTTTVGYLLIPDIGDDLTFDLVGKRIFYFFELLEGVRSLVNSAGAAQKSRVYASPPLISQLSVASPTNIVVEIAQTAHQLLPVAYFTASLKAAGALPEKRKEWYEGSAAKQRMEQEKKTPEQQKALGDLEIRLKTAEAEKAEAEAVAAKADADAKSYILEQLRQILPSSEITDELANAVIDNSILPAVRNLAEARITEIRPDPNPSRNSQADDAATG